MYGCDNQNTPKGFAVRDMSYLEMALHPNDILFYSRIQYKMGNYTGLQYVGLKDGENSWIYDFFNENYVNHLKSKDDSNKDLFWTYEPFPPVICHGDYQTMDPDRLLCQDIASLYLQDTMTNQLLFQNIPLDPIITDQTEFTFLFFTQVLFVQEYQKHLIYQFNPTAPSDSDKLIMFYESQILPISPIEKRQYYYMRHAFHEQPTFSITADFNAWNLYGLRCTKDGYITNFDRNSFGQTHNNIIRPVAPYFFDQKIQIGGQYLYQTENLANPKMKIRDLIFLPNVVLTDELVRQFQYKKLNRIGPYSVPFHYPLTENSQIQVQYNKGITDSIEYQKFDLSSYPGIESFYISDTFNYDRSLVIYKYVGSNPMFYNFQPSQQIDDWTLQFYAMSVGQSVSKNLFLHSQWLKINMIQSNLTYQLIFFPNNAAQIYSLYTTETFQFNYWTYTTITYKHSEKQLYFYKDGLILNQFVGGEPIPTDLVNLLLDVELLDVLLIDFRIWKECLSTPFISYNFKKRLNGYYYPNLILYLDLTFTLSYSFNYRVFQDGKFEWRPTSYYQTGSLNPTSFCSQDQVYDGENCQTIKYLWLKTDELHDLKLPILNLQTISQGFTLEFWFLIIKNSALGNIFQLQLDSGTGIQYLCHIEPTILDYFQLINCDSDGNLIPNSANTILNYDSNTNYLLKRSTLSYTLQNWHKFSLIFDSLDNSLSAFIDLQQMTSILTLTSSAAQILSKMKEITFCFQNSCNMVVQNFAINLGVIQLITRQDLMFVPSTKANIHSLWALTESQGFTLYDTSNNWLQQNLLISHSNQNLIWSNIHKISQDDGIIIICGIGSTQNEKGQCTQTQSTYMGIFPSTSNNFKLLNQPDNENLSRDWTFEFWCMFKIDKSLTNIFFTIISQESPSPTTCQDQGQTRIIYDLNSQGSKRIIKTIIEDQSNGNLLNIPNSQQLYAEWSHYAIINKGNSEQILVLKDSIIQNNGTSNQMIGPLSGCNFILGKNSYTDNKFLVLIKELRIWNDAPSLHVFRTRMLYGLQPNHPGLVRYYKFNDERILELVSNRENRVGLGQNLISSSEDNFDFSCPAGYSFQDNLNDCILGFSYTRINNLGWLKMNYQNYLEPLIKEQDYTFTFLITIATGTSYKGDFFNNLDLFKVISVNKTYKTSYKWGSQYGSPISSNDASPMYWFFNYDVSKGIFSYYVGNNLIFKSQFISTEMPDFENYIMRVGFETSKVEIYFKNFQIFYPQLTSGEISKIVSGQSNQFKYKSGLITMFETQENKYTTLYDYDGQPYDMIGESWDTYQSYRQNTSEIRSTTGWSVCPFNYIYKSFNCYPYSSLLLQNGNLQLNTAALKIGYSATIMFEFTVLKFPTAPASPIILMHLIQVVKVHILNQQLFVQCLSPNLNATNLVFYTQQTINLNEKTKVALVFFK
eukprot:403352626